MITRLRYLIVGAILLGGTGLGHGTVMNGTANLVLGQANFVANSTYPVSGTALFFPQAVAVEAGGRVFVADTYNNRVLWWNNAASLTNGQAADGVLGQAGLDSGQPNRGGGPTDGTFYLPAALCIDSLGRLWVADSGNNRVLRFDSPTTKPTADFVLGQANMTSAFSAVGRDKMHFPLGVGVDSAGNVWVADESNNRVLGFTAANVATRLADYVIGQADFDSRVTTDTVVSASSLFSPQGLFVEPSGVLWVADDSNNRVLRYSPPFTQTGKAADLELGQADFNNTGLSKEKSQNRGSFANAGTLHCAIGVGGDGNGNIYVADFDNNRVLRFNGTLTNGKNATQVIGQENFTSIMPNRGGAPADNTLFHPTSVYVDPKGNLWVTEGSRFSSCHVGGNNRVLKFNSITVTSLDPILWNDSGPKAVTISGTGFSPASSARLTKTGQSDIPGKSLNFINEGQVQFTFDFAGAAPGTWNLVLTNGEFETTMADAMTIVPVKVASISPAKAINTAPVDVTVTGENFMAGMALKLTRGNQAINADPITVVSSSQITGRFDILDATTGFWNVSAAPTNEGTLRDAFDVHFPSMVARTILRTRSYRLGMETEKGTYTFGFPKGAFKDDVLFTAALPHGIVPSVNETEFKSTDIVIEINNDKNLQPVKIVDMGFYYPEALAAGLDRTKFAASFCDETTGRWIPVYSWCDDSGNCVLAKTRHFCFYRIIQLVPAASLSSVKAYPNPLMPGSGGKFDSPDLSGGAVGIVFNGLTGSFTIRIFNVAGELVRQDEKSGSAGVYVWDTRNDNGEQAGSGVYIYYITSPDSSETQKGKISIIR